MKTLKTKVILSAVVLLFALVATIGSTFAWFTVATTVQVNSMTLNVGAENSILIRLANANGTLLGTENVDDDLLDASQYKTTLINADIAEYYAFSTFKLSPVTAVNSLYTAATVSPKNLNTMVVSDANLVRALESVVAGDKNSATGKYIELNFYLYSQGLNTVNIGVNNVVVTTVAANEDAQDNVVNAVRLGVWRAGASNGTTYTAEPGNTGYIFGTDIDYAFTFIDGLPGYYDSSVPVAGAFNRINDFSTTDSVTLEADMIVGSNPATTVFTLASEIPTLVTVVIYVEGWDSDTTNAIISAAFNISFKFSILS